MWACCYSGVAHLSSHLLASSFSWNHMSVCFEQPGAPMWEMLHFVHVNDVVTVSHGFLEFMGAPSPGQGALVVRVLIHGSLV